MDAPTSVYVSSDHHEKTGWEDMQGRRRGEAKSSIKAASVLYWQGLKCIGVKAESKAKWKERGWWQGRAQPAPWRRISTEKGHLSYTQRKREKEAERTEHLLVALSKEMTFRGKDAGLHREVQKSQPPSSSNGTAGDSWEVTGRRKASTLVSTCHFPLANHNWWVAAQQWLVVSRMFDTKFTSPGKSIYHSSLQLNKGTEQEVLPSAIICY